MGELKKTGSPLIRVRHNFVVYSYELICAIKKRRENERRGSNDGSHRKKSGEMDGWRVGGWPKLQSVRRANKNGTQGTESGVFGSRLEFLGDTEKKSFRLPVRIWRNTSVSSYVLFRNEVVEKRLCPIDLQNDKKLKGGKNAVMLIQQKYIRFGGLSGKILASNKFFKCNFIYLEAPLPSR